MLFGLHFQLCLLNFQVLLSNRHTPAASFSLPTDELKPYSLFNAYQLLLQNYKETEVHSSGPFELGWTVFLDYAGPKANLPSWTKHWQNERASKSGTSLQSSNLSLRSSYVQGRSWPPATVCFLRHVNGIASHSLWAKCGL